MNTDSGSYTIEAAFTLSVFTAAVLAILSVFLVIKIESDIDAALEETAVEISQYCYVTDISVSDARDYLVENFDKSSSWYVNQGIKNGLAGMDFSKSQILQGSKYINLQVDYDLQLKSFGLVSKTFHMTQCAGTCGLASESSLLDRLDLSGSDSASIWKENNFVRGKYFVGKLKDENPEYAVKSGCGIDLYNSQTGEYTEAFSLNIFNESYKTEETFQKLLEYHAVSLKNDIEALGAEVELESGAKVPKNTAKIKRLVMIVPEEAQTDEYSQRIIATAQSRLLTGQGVTLEIRYSEKALEE